MSAVALGSPDVSLQQTPTYTGWMREGFGPPVLILDHRFREIDRREFAFLPGERVAVVAHDGDTLYISRLGCSARKASPSPCPRALVECDQ